MQRPSWEQDSGGLGVGRGAVMGGSEGEPGGFRIFRRKKKNRN